MQNFDVAIDPIEEIMYATNGWIIFGPILVVVIALIIVAIILIRRSTQKKKAMGQPFAAAPPPVGNPQPGAQGYPPQPTNVYGSQPDYPPAATQGYPPPPPPPAANPLDSTPGNPPA